MGSVDMSVKNAGRKYNTAGRRDNVAYYQTYVDGNTVRKIEMIPEEPVRKHAHREQTGRKNRKARQKALQLNVGYALFLTLIMGLLLFGCIKYLQIQATVTSTMRSINAMESQLSDLKAENDAEYNRVAAAENLDEIRKIAMEELGMVYASESQVVHYDSKNTDYVRQYQDVPNSVGDVQLETKAASIFGW